MVSTTDGSQLSCYSSATQKNCLMIVGNIICSDRSVSPLRLKSIFRAVGKSENPGGGQLVICLLLLRYGVILSVKMWGERHGPIGPLRLQGLRHPCIFPLLLHIGVFPVLSISSSFIYIISEEITWSCSI